MIKYLLVEGVTDVAFIKYICLVKNIINNFNDFIKTKNEYNFNNLIIVDLGGQDNLNKFLERLKSKEIKISKIGIIQDADNNFEKSKENIENAIQNSKIDKNKIDIFLTPNNQDKGDLETLLLSTIKNNNIIECFDDYKKCLLRNDEIHPKALNKGQVYAYTMYSQKGENLYKTQDSFMYKKKKEYYDTKLWDLEKEEFKPIIKFVENIFEK